MKRARAVLIFASLAGFAFGAANGCGTEPLSSPRNYFGADGGLAATGGSAGTDTNVGNAGTPVGASGSPGAGGSDVTGAGGANGGTTGAGGGMAGTDVANGGAAGTGGASGVGGANTGSSGGGMAGADGATGGAAGAGGAGGASGGSSGAGGSPGAGGAGGAGGSTPVGCNNATVVDAAGSTTKCPAMNTWTATAMPTPPSMFMGIPDTKLQPKYAIDGNTGTRYSTGAISASGQWFRVDLGVATQITGIVLNDSVSVNDMPYGYKVEVSTDGTAWTQVATCNALPAGTTETINFAAKPGRYVRVTVTAPGIHWWSIDELSVLCK